jgi:cytochrome c-type biogenesis protein CcmH
MLYCLKNFIRCSCLSGFSIALLLVSVWTHAVVEIYEFDDDVTRQRYQSFIEELRCPKCQNQNLAGSDSAIAQDLRRELHRLLEDGQSDKEIIDFMVSRYGDYVLYRPQLKRNTMMLWGLPLILLLIGAVTVVLVVRVRNRKVDVSITDELDSATISEAKLKKLLQAANERQT